MRKNEDKLIHKIGRGVVTGVMTTALVAAPPVTMLAAQTVAVADETVITVSNASELTNAITNIEKSTNKTGKIQFSGDITSTVRIPANTSITIDLAGHTLKNRTDDADNQTTAEDTIYVSKDGTLTLDSSTGTGVVDNLTDSSAAVFNNGNTTLKNVTIKRSAEKGVDTKLNGNSWYYVLNHGTMTIDGATISSEGTYSSLIENGYASSTGGERKSHVEGFNIENPSLTIINGTFKGGKNTVKNDDNGVLTVNGGTFTNDFQTAVMNWNKATINNGNFSGKTSAISNGSYGADSQDKGNLIINNGTFTATNGQILGVNGGSKEGEGSLSIENGTFNNAVTSSSIPDAYAVSITGGLFVNDISSLVPNASVATVTQSDATTKYIVGSNNIVDAAKNANQDETITITKSSDNLDLPANTQANIVNQTDKVVTVGSTVLRQNESTQGKQEEADKKAAEEEKAKAEAEQKAAERKAAEQLQADKSALNGAIANMNSLLNTMDQKRYSSDSIQALRDAIASAQRVADKKDATADEISQAQKGLTDAYKALAPAPGIAMFRLYNPYSGEHLYTSSASERDSLASIGWRAEGTGWVAPASSNTPVFRLYNPYSGDHHYTESAAERDSLVSIGWRYEGIGWFSDDEKGVPVYREFNPYEQVGTHNYTTSAQEDEHLGSIGWRREGIAWYGIKADTK